MSENGADRLANVVVLGNPNAGKSTLFNALTGIKQHVGNYPGVTVEKRTGEFRVGDLRFNLTDLPGTYSLAPHSPEEMLTVKVLLGKPPAASEPDLILCVVDANNLERNLFLVSQLLELNRPTVIAVNMIDVASRHGLAIDCQQLSKLLGVAVVPVQANQKRGFEQLRAALVESLGQVPAQPHLPFEGSLRDRIERLESVCPDNHRLNRFVISRMLFDTDGFMQDQMKSELPDQWLSAVAVERTELQQQEASAFESESTARYAWIAKHIDAVVEQVKPRKQRSTTDRIDRWLTHPVFGLLIAGAVLVALFQLVFMIAEPASTMIDWFNGTLSGWVDLVVSPGPLNSLLVDGLINGVGSVLIFLPQILLLFLILGLLEDSGYLARAAFLLDQYLARLGLSGVSLFPLLSSFACAIPGVMATRVIKDYRERMITILIAPLMSCSARLPVYVLMIAVFVPDQYYLGGWLGLRGLTMLAMYLVGIVAAVVVAWLLRKTILPSTASSFVLELPSYKFPSLRNVWQRMFDGGWAFVRDAGTMIVAVTIIVWAIAYFPRVDANNPPPELAGAFDQIAAANDQLANVDRDEQLTEEETEQLNQQVRESNNQIAAYQLRHSILGRLGRGVEPIVKPLGWDWRIGSAAIASFPAREVVVSTLGVIFGLGSDVDEESGSLRGRLESATWEGTNRPLFTLPVALSIMVFFALCAQCVSTLAVIRRETNSYRWPLFTFVYMTVLAYVAALVTYQVCSRIWEVV